MLKKNREKKENKNKCQQKVLNKKKLLEFVQKQKNGFQLESGADAESYIQLT